MSMLELSFRSRYHPLKFYPYVKYVFGDFAIPLHRPKTKYGA